MVVVSGALDAVDIAVWFGAELTSFMALNARVKILVVGVVLKAFTGTVRLLARTGDTLPAGRGAIEAVAACAFFIRA